jgi:hypothetical protein
MVEDVKNKQLKPFFLDSSQESQSSKSEIQQVTTFSDDLNLEKKEEKAVSPYIRKSAERLRDRLKSGRGIF